MGNCCLQYIRQNSGSLTVLDPKDEQPCKEGWHWRHMSNMADKAGITFSLTFRSVRETAEVKPSGELVSPKLKESKKQKFQEAERIIDSIFYKEARRDLEERMQLFFDKWT